MAPVKFYIAGTQVSHPAVLYPRKARNRLATIFQGEKPNLAQL